MFFGADGRPWFALDEQRRDVPLDQISPHLRRAVVAVATDLLPFSTGQVIDVDGGFHLKTL